MDEAQLAQLQQLAESSQETQEPLYKPQTFGGTFYERSGEYILLMVPIIFIAGFLVFANYRTNQRQRQQLEEAVRKRLESDLYDNAAAKRKSGEKHIH